MHIAVACGGTGGHAFPGVMTAQALQRRGHVVTLWLAGRDAEAGVLSGWEGPVVRLLARGFQEGFSAGGIGVGLGQVRAAAQAFARMRRERPDVLLGMGSYATVPPALAARALGIPLVLHEANAVPGRAVSFLARFARAVGITFQASAVHLPAVRTVVTGLPLRAFSAPPFAGPPLEDHAFTVLVMGGSQGAHALNALVPAAICELRAQGRSIQVIHLSGGRDEAQVRATYVAGAVPNQVFGFLERVERAYGRAQLAICRSGAGSCMELARATLPAILVPLPTARRNHQWHNAQALAGCGGARLMDQQTVTQTALTAAIGEYMDQPMRLADMRRALRGMAITDGAEALADLVEETGASGRANVR